MLNKQNKKIIILGFLVVFATLMFLFSAKSTFDKKQNEADIFFENQKKLGRLIKLDGVYKAYSVFEKIFYNYEPSSRHYLGHFMGQQAYKILGEKGFDVCDFGLDYGCIHGFVIAGINEKGNGFINTVMDKCKSIDPKKVERVSCIHGVSHTILSLKGYGVGDLTWALAQCDKTLAIDIATPEACYSAVFMEYNLMSLDGTRDGNWAVSRVFDPQNPVFPCNNLGFKYQWSCFSELSSFWSNNFNMDFPRMANYCSEANLNLSEKGCFWGLGRTMADLYKYDVPKISSECLKISPKNMLFSCIQGAAVVIQNNIGKTIPEICNVVVQSEKSDCTKSLLTN